MSCKIVKPRSEEIPLDGGGSYLSIEKAMKKKKKRKNPPPDDDASRMITSNVDPSLLVRVPHDNRVNVDGVLDKKKLQSKVAKWGQTDTSHTGLISSTRPARDDVNEDGLVEPQTGYVVALSSEIDVVSHGAVGDRIQVVSKNSTVAPVSRPTLLGIQLRLVWSRLNTVMAG